MVRFPSPTVFGTIFKLVLKTRCDKLTIEGFHMTKLEYTFKNDTLFKMLFVKYPDLLKNLVTELLRIRFDSIEQIELTLF